MNRQGGKLEGIARYIQADKTAEAHDEIADKDVKSHEELSKISKSNKHILDELAELKKTISKAKK